MTVLPGQPSGGSSSSSADKLLTGGLLAAGLLVAIPFAMLGPGIVLDDWYTLWWAWRDGVWHASGPTQWRARPLGAVVYNLQYGVIGAHPLLWFLIQATVTAVTAALLFRLLRRFLPASLGAAVAAVWLVSANHTALDHWGAGSLASLALALGVGGALALLRGEEGSSPGWTCGGVALLVASPLVYEATLPAAFLAAVVLPHLAGWRPSGRQVAVRSLPFLAAGAWLVTGSFHLKNDQGWFDLPSTLPALFGSGIARWAVPSALLLAVGLSGCLAALAGVVSPLARHLIPGGPSGLIGSGAAVAAVGYSAFLRYPISAVGVGDRANVVAAVGGAMVWVGLGWALYGRRHLFAPLTLTFALLLTAARVGRAADWAAAGDDSRRILAVAAPAVRDAPPGRLLVVGPPPKGHNGIVGLVGTIRPAIQYTLKDKTRRSTVAVTEAEWAAVPQDRRIDINLLPP